MYVHAQGKRHAGKDICPDCRSGMSGCGTSSFSLSGPRNVNGDQATALLTGQVRLLPELCHRDTLRQVAHIVMVQAEWNAGWQQQDSRVQRTVTLARLMAKGKV